MRIEMEMDAVGDTTYYYGESPANDYATYMNGAATNKGCGAAAW